MRTASDDLFEAVEDGQTVSRLAAGLPLRTAGQGLARMYNPAATAEQVNRDSESGDLLTDMPWSAVAPATPEKRLLFAIIVDAWDRVAAFRRGEATGRVNREAQRDALEVFRWVEGLGESEPRLFSFQAICEHLGWESTQVRVAFYGDVQHVGMGQQGTRAKVGLRRERRSTRGTRSKRTTKRAASGVADEVRQAG